MLYFLILVVRVKKEVKDFKSVSLSVGAIEENSSFSDTQRRKRTEEDEEEAWEPKQRLLLQSEAGEAAPQRSIWSPSNASLRAGLSLHPGPTGANMFSVMLTDQ